jgi:transcriptional regulator with XRE-family HTH domain
MAWKRGRRSPWTPGRKAPGSRARQAPGSRARGRAQGAGVGRKAPGASAALTGSGVSMARWAICAERVTTTHGTWPDESRSCLPVLRGPESGRALSIRDWQACGSGASQGVADSGSEGPDKSRIRDRGHHAPMADRERRRDRGVRRARADLARLGAELRDARRALGLRQSDVAKAAGISASWVSRIEVGSAPEVGFRLLSVVLAVVGLDLSARAYPGGSPLRDEGHRQLLGRFRALLPAGAGWRTEVPLPLQGDQRAWDAQTDLWVSRWAWKPRPARVTSRRWSVGSCVDPCCNLLVLA